MASLNSVLLEQGTPSISVDIEGVERRLILDTGSNVSIMQPGISGSVVEVTHIQPYGVTGEVLKIKGQQTVSFVVDGREFSHTFLVCSLPTDAAGLLGTDFLNEAVASIDFECRKMSFADIGKSPRACKVSPTKGAALTIFTEGKEGHSPQPCLREARHKDEQLSASPPREATTAQNETWLVKAKENITIGPRCRQIVTGIVESGKEQKIPPLVCIAPVQIPIEGTFSARALSRVEQPEHVITSQNDHKPTGRLHSCACVMVANFSDEALTIPKATVLGIAEGISESLVDKINAKSGTNFIEPVKPPRKRKNETLYNKLLQGKLDYLTSEEKA